MKKTNPIRHFNIWFLSMSFCLIQSAFAQSGSSRPRNTIGINFMGDASLLSLNYERTFLHKNWLFLSAKTGLGINREFKLFGAYSHAYGTAPISLSANIGKHKNFLEIGVGFTALANDKDLFFFSYPIVGYRFYPLVSKRFFIRVFAEIPLISQEIIQQSQEKYAFPILYDRVLFSPIGCHLGIAF